MARKAGFERRQILERARDLFWRKGYHATSMKDLEVALDLRPGSIYAAFGSKVKLYAEALEVYAEGTRSEALATMQAAPSALSGLAEHVRALGRVGERDLPSNACMLVKTVLEVPEDSNLLRKTAEDLLSKAEAAFTEQFRKAKAARELPADADPVRLGRRYQADVIGLRAYAQRSGSSEAVALLAEDIALGVEGLRATS